MQSINFATGIKEYAVNGDESNVIRINVSDMNIAARFREHVDMFDKIESDIAANGNPTPEKMAEYDRTIKEKIDYIFGADVSAHAFRNANCLSPVGNGKLLFTAFLEVFMEQIKRDTEKLRPVGAKHGNVSKYLPHEKKSKKNAQKKKPVNLDNLTPKQRAYLESLGE